MNRGSRDWWRVIASSRTGFNEAPIHESGKSSGRAARCSRSSSFNEAPIHESGKSYRLHHSAHAERRFNEAPIHESGKFLARKAADDLRVALQ